MTHAQHIEPAYFVAVILTNCNRFSVDRPWSRGPMLHACSKSMILAYHWAAMNSCFFSGIVMKHLQVQHPKLRRRSPPINDKKWATLQSTWALVENFTTISSNLQVAQTSLMLIQLVHILQAKRLTITEKLLQKGEITFSDNVLAIFLWHRESERRGGCLYGCDASSLPAAQILGPSIYVAGAIKCPPSYTYVH